jgi:hypothetical protein
VNSCWPHAQPPRWRATPCRLSAITYSIYSQLGSICGGRLLNSFHWKLKSTRLHGGVIFQKIIILIPGATETLNLVSRLLNYFRDWFPRERRRCNMDGSALLRLITLLLILRRHASRYATSQKVAGSVPDEVTGFCTWPNPSSRTMAPGSTQPLTEMSTRDLPGGKGRPARKADDLTAICEPIV